jgi:hypothetical protein
MEREFVRAEIQPRAVSWDSAPDRDDLPSDQIFIHRISDLQALKKSYQSQGWNTDVILQSPSHKGPTTAKPVGFPFNFTLFTQLFSRWGEVVVLRLHIDVIRYKGRLASWPHAEPDPKYEPEKHIEMFIAKNEIRGEPVVSVLGQFYRD